MVMVFGTKVRINIIVFVPNTITMSCSMLFNLRRRTRRRRTTTRRTTTRRRRRREEKRREKKRREEKRREGKRREEEKGYDTLATCYSPVLCLKDEIRQRT